MLAADQQREPERQRQLDGERERQDDEVVLQRPPEDLVVEDAVEVVEPDVVLERAQALPAIEPVVPGLEERKEDEERVDHRRRQQEQRDGRGPAQIEAAGVPATAARRRNPAARGDCLHRPSPVRSRAVRRRDGRRSEQNSPFLIAVPCTASRPRLVR